MIYLKGINLHASSLRELHTFAYKVGVERCWFDIHRECYDVIDPNKIEKILSYLKKQNG